MGYKQLRRSDFARLSRPHTPVRVVQVAAYETTQDEAAFRGDAQAAYAMALMWVVTDDKRYRDKAIAILDDWAGTFEGLEVIKGGTSQSNLEASWAATVWIAAADIIRFYRMGAANWASERILVFNHFIDNLIAEARGKLEDNSNRGMSATLACLAAAVFQEDEKAYNEAIELHKKRVGMISLMNGALGPDYLSDPWHAQATIISWIHISEIAWIQGDDIYGSILDDQLEPRLAICLEHFAKLFLGKIPNPEGLLRGDYRGSHMELQGYYVAFNHFIVRKDLRDVMPTFYAMVPGWVPGGFSSHFVAWDTLSHAGVKGGTALR
jgi:hypothetical protein